MPNVTCHTFFDMKDCCYSMTSRNQWLVSTLPDKHTCVIITNDDLTLRAPQIERKAKLLFGNSKIHNVPFARHDTLNSVFKNTNANVLNIVKEFIIENQNGMKS